MKIEMRIGATTLGAAAVLALGGCYVRGYGSTHGELSHSGSASGGAYAQQPAGGVYAQPPAGGAYAQPPAGGAQVVPAAPAVPAGSVQVTVYALPPVQGVPVVTTGTVFGGPRPQAGKAFRGTVYAMQPGSTHLQNPATLQPLTTLYTTRLDVSYRSWTDGFPGVPGGHNEWFQIEYEGSFETRTAGTYGFRLFSDDGSRLYVDDRVVIENQAPRTDPNRSGSTQLQPGVHRIRVEYFQGPRAGLGLQLFVTPPGGAEQIFDITSTY